MFLNIAVALFYLLRRTFFWCRFEVLWLFALVFCIAHKELLKILLFLVILPQDSQKQTLFPSQNHRTLAKQQECGWFREYATTLRLEYVRHCIPWLKRYEKRLIRSQQPFRG